MAPCFSYHHPKVEVRAAGPGKGLGLFARALIARGEVLVITGGRILTAREYRDCGDGHLPFQVDVELHLAPLHDGPPEGIFAVNHSCRPNAAMAGQSGLLALRDLEAGEEIAYDYATTDSDSPGLEPFSMRCLCGAAECRGTITDRDWRRPDLRERYAGLFAPYLAARIARE